MTLRAYRKKFDDWLVAQCATSAGYRRVWIILIVVSIVGDIVILGPLIASLK